MKKRWFHVLRASRRASGLVHFIQGDSDPITPTSLVIDYYEIIMFDKKEMIVINNAGHTPFLDNPEQFCEAVKTFLSECENE